MPDRVQSPWIHHEGIVQPEPNYPLPSWRAFGSAALLLPLLSVTLAFADTAAVRNAEVRTRWSKL